MKVTYRGDAPGQAGDIKIAGFRFSRGKTYDIPAADVKRLGLDTKGGFEVASGGKSKKDEESD